jgi:hypothetical protein
MLIIGLAAVVSASAAPVAAATPTGESSTPPALAEPAAPTECRPDARLSMADLTAVVRPWIEALWSLYESGDEATLTDLATQRGLERLMEVDWRAAAVAREGARFREDPEVIDFNDWQEWCADGTRLVALDVEPIVRIGPGARTFDAASGTPIEAAEGEQLRALEVRLTRASDADAWLVDDVRVSDFAPRYIRPMAARPCPGLRDPSSVADPFMLEPWCAANGDGRRIPTRGPAAELGVGAYACKPGAHDIVIGLPPGTPMGFSNTRSYVRDPRGRTRRALGRAFSPPGFRRDFRPPRDAISSGITNGYATIWTSERLGDEWLLVKVGNRFERWPQSTSGCGA